MKQSGVKAHQVDEQVSDANISRRHLIQGALLSTVAASAPVEAAEQRAHQGGESTSIIGEMHLHQADDNARWKGRSADWQAN